MAKYKLKKGRFTFKGKEYNEGDLIETEPGILPVNLFEEIKEKPKSVEVFDKLKPKKETGYKKEVD